MQMRASFRQKFFNCKHQNSWRADKILHAKRVTNDSWTIVFSSLKNLLKMFDILNADSSVVEWGQRTFRFLPKTAKVVKKERELLCGERRIWIHGTTPANHLRTSLNSVLILNSFSEQTFCYFLIRQLLIQFGVVMSCDLEMTFCA